MYDLYPYPDAITQKNNGAELHELAEITVSSELDVCPALSTGAARTVLSAARVQCDPTLEAVNLSFRVR